jgi:probable rRNA maturation factor
VHEAGDWSEVADRDRLIASAGDALARHPRFTAQAPAEACVALSDDATVRALNARFRGQDKPTNVLSFPAPPLPGGMVSPLLGDVVLAQETLKREATEQNIALGAHLQHLVVHGLLHLIGLDHERDEDAREMEGLEVEVLAGLGIVNPYAGDDTAQITP